MSGIGVLLGITVVITAIKFYVVPSLDLSAIIPSPTPTLTLAPPTRPTMTLAPTVALTLTMPITPTATARFTPTREVTPSPTPSPETPTPPPPPAAACADANVCITSPGMNVRVSGQIGIYGTANNARFQFYKVEYSQGENPGAWHGISNIHKNPVTGGLLEQFNTATLPNGVYWLQLTVVDITGNFPPPYAVRIVIQN